MTGQTPSQTVGPFFRFGLLPESYGHASVAPATLAGPDTPGLPIVVEGMVTDGAGAPAADAMLEFWQADCQGRYGAEASAAGFGGFARIGTDPNGRFSFATIMPGAVAGPGGQRQAPHINLILFARGLLQHNFTRIYFDDQEAANDADPIMRLVPLHRRRTLIAAARTGAGGARIYRFDLRMQGADETVFFDL